MPRFIGQPQLHEPLASVQHRASLGLALVDEAAVPGVADAEVRRDVVPGAPLELRLQLRNEGSQSWVLTAMKLQRPLSGFTLEPRGVREGSLVEPGGSLSVLARIDMPVDGYFHALVVAELTPASSSLGFSAAVAAAAAGVGSRVSVTCDIALHCASPEHASVEAFLAPSSPFERRRMRAAVTDHLVDPPARVEAPGGPLPPRVPFVPDPPTSAAQRFAMLASASSTPLDPGSHARRFRTLLLVEESAAREALEEYDMAAARLKRTGGGGPLLRLAVPGLTEGRPSLMKGDTVVVSRSGGGGGEGYRGRIDEVERDAVLLAFHRRVADAVDGVWDVRFELSRSAYKRQHAALETGWAPPPAVLFPHPIPDGAMDTAAADAVLKDRLQAPPLRHNLNEPQRMAVSGALSRVPGADVQPPFIIFGPPGARPSARCFAASC